MKFTIKTSAVRLLITTLALSALFISILALIPSSHAQQRRSGQRREASALLKMPNAPRNPVIARMVSEINAGNIERAVRKLVSFGTRNTLSVQDNPTRGIGAARDWLYAEFLAISQATGGRMKVEKQSFEQQPGKYPRIARPTVVTNVVATLRGTQPASENRLYVVSGHYDSMCTSPTDAECDAPGANDDASGTAAVLEMARVMAKYEFEATNIFMAVAGEE